MCPSTDESEIPGGEPRNLQQQDPESPSTDVGAPHSRRCRYLTGISTIRKLQLAAPKLEIEVTERIKAGVVKRNEMVTAPTTCVWLVVAGPPGERVG
jgi:hypothetical protein